MRERCTLAERPANLLLINFHALPDVGAFVEPSYSGSYVRRELPEYMFPWKLHNRSHC